MRPTPAAPPATAGGNHHTQLQHLKGHRRFQNQQQHEQLQLDWATTITKAQSYRHITTKLHRKINTKGTCGSNPGKLATPEGDLFLKRLARMLNNGERLSPGDIHMMCWNMRQRVLKAHRIDLTGRDRQTLPNGNVLDLLPPKDASFPPEIREAHQYRQRLKQLLKEQGISPKRHRNHLIAQAYHCGGCRNINTVTEVEPKGECPTCHNPQHYHTIVELAVTPESPYAEYLTADDTKPRGRTSP